MVGLGLSIGLYLLGALEVASTPISYDHTSWFFKWCELLGIALLAVELIAASLIAVHSRRRAGIFFLASLPITVFCLAYREVHFMSGGSETYSGSTGFQWLGSFFVGCVLLLFFGLFWLGTHWRRWPALTQLHPETFTTRMSRVAIACLMVAGDRSTGSGLRYPASLEFWRTLRRAHTVYKAEVTTSRSIHRACYLRRHVTPELVIEPIRTTSDSRTSCWRVGDRRCARSILGRAFVLAASCNADGQRLLAGRNVFRRWRPRRNALKLFCSGCVGSIPV
jgi:hypothetical protein